MNDYELIRNIEAHGYGRVDVVQDKNTSKLYISKIVYKTSEDLRIHQLRTEIDVLSTIHYPYIPELIDVYDCDAYIQFFETFIDGQSLGSSISFMKRKQYYLECIQCIEQVHGIGFYYVDIKESNFLVYQDHVYLIDFNACLPIESKNIVMQTQTFSQDISQVDSKGLVELYRLFYKHSLSYFLLKLLCVRVQAVSQVRRRYLFIERLKRCLLLITITLSVFFLVMMNRTVEDPLDIYLQTPNVNHFTSAYIYTLNEQDGTASQKAQANLYEWMENDWFVPILFSTPESVDFLISQAIQSKNNDLCIYIWKHCDASNKQRIQESKTWLSLSAYLDEEFDVDQLLKQAQEPDEIMIVLEVLSTKQILLDEHQIDVLYKMQESMKSKATEAYAFEYLEYSLFLKSKRCKTLDIPEWMVNKFEKSDQWKNMYEIWRQSK